MLSGLGLRPVSQTKSNDVQVRVKKLVSILILAFSSDGCLHVSSSSLHPESGLNFLQWPSNMHNIYPCLLINTHATGITKYEFTQLPMQRSSNSAPATSLQHVSPPAGEGIAHQAAPLTAVMGCVATINWSSRTASRFNQQAKHCFRIEASSDEAIVTFDAGAELFFLWCCCCCSYCWRCCCCCCCRC